jgi:hypothetical protein
LAAPGLAIGRLATRVRAPGAAEGEAARRLVAEATTRLGPAMEAALPRVLARAGLGADALLTVPRLALRLRLRGRVDAARLGEAWAEALAAALEGVLAGGLAAAPAGPREGAAGAPEDAPALHDRWAAEAALLAALAAGEALPWWAALVAPGLDAPGGVAALLGSWLTRDPARAVAWMARLLEAAPALPARLAPVEAAWLAARIEAALASALAAFGAPPAPAGADGTAGTDAAGWPAALGLLAGALAEGARARLAALDPARRAPWLLAALLAARPAMAGSLAPLLARPGAADALLRPAELARARQGATPAAAPEAAAQAPASATLAPQAEAEVLGGGLLLLLAPLARLEPGWLAEGAALPARLTTLGLRALSRLAAPLAPGARRAALERDRPLLTVFAGAEPPEGPLDEVALDPRLALEAEAALARLLAAAPARVAEAPGALRRLYAGRDPFAGDPGQDLLCRLVLRPGRLRWDAASAELLWPHAAADAALRRAGWDLDPGWLPWIGRRIAFRYGESA